VKDLRVQPYTPTDLVEDLPDSVQAIMALRFGVFPSSPQALYRFSGDRDFLRNLRAARRALDTAFKSEKTDRGTMTSVRRGGCRILMDNAHHAALTSALGQAIQQGIPNTMLDGMDCASTWLQGAMEVDPNKPEKVKGKTKPAK
jgi:hypothetical protein